MRIMDRQAFLAMPAGTVFVKVRARPKAQRHVTYVPEFADMAVKYDTDGSAFGKQELVPGWFAGCEDSEDLVDALVRMDAGSASAVDYDTGSRDKPLDPDEQFGVLSLDDLDALIRVLTEARALLASQAGGG